MDLVYDNYTKKYKKIKELLNSTIENLTWNLNNTNLVLFSNKLPVGVFEIKLIGEIKDNKFIWAWENKENYIDKNLYPTDLKKNIIGTQNNIFLNNNNIFLNIIIALEVLNGIWYIYLQDDNINKIAIITKIIKLYK
jgi:hypothetical protein